MKTRLDLLLLQRKLATTIEEARAIIGAGEVYVSERIADKAGLQYANDINIRIKERCPYVSRGGLKLEKALSHFNISPENWTCLDVGASTGGFTDCLLQHGAKKIIAVDVAYGQLAWKIRQDPRVLVMERFNARKISVDDLKGETIRLAVIDASFISLTKLIPPLVPLFGRKVAIIALIKPQFELGREDVGPGGIVTDPELHQKAILKIDNFAAQHGLLNIGSVISPIRGPKGNREFLMYLASKKDMVL